MRLTRLEIENFKGIGERQVIEIRPITLLFGPNSAGKSTILQAVEYLHQVLQGNLLGSDIKNTSKAGHEWSDFESLVHCHDLKKVIRIKADVRLNENFYGEYFPINWATQKDPTPPEHELPPEQRVAFGSERFAGLPINYIAGDPQTSKVTDVAVAIEVAWQDASDQIFPKMSSAYLRSLEIDINNQYIITIRPQQPYLLYGKTIVEVNYEHYLLNGSDSVNEAVYGLPDQTNIYNLQEKKKKWPVEHGEEMDAEDNDIEDNNADQSRRDVISPFSKEIFEVVYQGNSELDEIVPEVIGKLSISEFNLHSLTSYEFHYSPSSSKDSADFPINFVSTNSNTNEGGDRWLRLQEIFSELISAPIKSVLGATYASSVSSSLSPSSVIGPLRSIPPRGKSGTILDDTNDLGNIQKVNHWLENRFELDYTIERFKSKLVPEIASKPIKGLEDYISNRSSQDETITKLYDKRRDIYLDFVDVGVGISQLVPVIVAAVGEDFGLVKIEQPELHVHPAIQVELGDLFIESAREHEGMERTFLIETHSEHLLLRLLRRIQEATDNELPPNTVGLKAEDLSVIYIEPVRTEKRIRTRVKQMRVDKTGEFDWPNGFFDERYGELF